MKKIKINDEIYVGDSDKKLKDYLSDTGWLNCTLLNSKFIVNWFETRKIGNIVMITAQLNNPSNNSIGPFELIGKTAYPAKEEVFNSCRITAKSSSEQSSLIYIDREGSIYYMGPICDVGIQFSFTYFVN